jgi:hypothetical protein
MMQSLARGKAVALAAGLVALAACSGNVAPNDQAAFDAARVEAGIRSVERAANAPALESFRALGQHVGAVGVQAGGAASGSARLVRALDRIVDATRFTGAALVPIIRSSVLGTTFVYDPAQKRYVADPARTGAPANGVRFILYEVEAESGTPIPEREVGHADLTDERRGAPNTLGLKFEVEAGGVTHLRYTFDLSGSIGSAEAAVRGFLSDGTERVDFDLTTTGQLFGRGGTATLDARLAVPSQDFEVRTRLTGTAGEENGDGRLELTVRARSDVIEVEAETRSRRIDATFTVNGRLLARASGDVANPVIRGEGGRELTQEEMAALGAIVAFADGVFKLIGGLLEPAGALLVIALGLGG